MNFFLLLNNFKTHEREITKMTWIYLLNIYLHLPHINIITQPESCLLQIFLSFTHVN